ncbi:VOC family protein [Candidatus Saccharibacteria bacterium]|nr:VOC family protein [Candidatus Saccharibacteria bacterium]
MGKVNLDPYLFFDGKAEEAMNFYKGIFGGELTLLTMDSMPGTDAKDAKRIMHALLDGEVRLMASDSHQASPETSKIELSIGGDDEAKLRGWFDALAEGGTTKMTLEKVQWGDIYGQLKDKYGVEWMVNISQPAGK